MLPKWRGCEKSFCQPFCIGFKLFSFGCHVAIAKDQEVNSFRWLAGLLSGEKRSRHRELCSVDKLIFWIDYSCPNIDERILRVAFLQDHFDSCAWSREA